MRPSSSRSLKFSDPPAKADDERFDGVDLRRYILSRAIEKKKFKNPGILVIENKSKKLFVRKEAIRSISEVCKVFVVNHSKKGVKLNFWYRNPDLFIANLKKDVMIRPQQQIMFSFNNNCRLGVVPAKKVSYFAYCIDYTKKGHLFLRPTDFPSSE